MQDVVKASAAALLVPAAVLGAGMILALSGGFGALGSLGQAFAGPALPAFAKLPGPVGRPGHRSSALAVALSSARSNARSPAPGAPPPATQGGRPTPSRASRPGTFHQGGGHVVTPGGGHRPGPTPAPPPTSGPPAGGPPPSGPPPSPASHPTVIDGVVSLGTSVTGRLPAPVGTIATQTLKSVGQAVGGGLTPRSSASRSAVSGVVSGLHLP